MNKLNEVKELCDGIEYSRHIPEDAELLAKENNIIVIVGGSDDLMYCYGATSYLSSEREHSYGWDGDTLKGIDDKGLENEASQLGLKIWWCGEIVADQLSLSSDNYSIKENGAFSYSVDDNIESLDFKVMEEGDVYCTGKIIKLPEGFKISLGE